MWPSGQQEDTGRRNLSLELDTRRSSSIPSRNFHGCRNSDTALRYRVSCLHVAAIFSHPNDASFAGDSFEMILSSSGHHKSLR